MDKFKIMVLRIFTAGLILFCMIMIFLLCQGIDEINIRLDTLEQQTGIVIPSEDYTRVWLECKELREEIERLDLNFMAVYGIVQILLEERDNNSGLYRKSNYTWDDHWESK